MFQLFEEGLLIAHHDYVHEANLRLLTFQKKLTLEEIITVLRMCDRFQVNTLAAINHMSNELLHRY